MCVALIIGTMCCEAVILFDKAVESELGYRVKRAGQLMEKARFLSGQLLGYLKDDAWLHAASNANKVAAYFGSEYDKIDECSLIRPTVTNLVYVEMLKEAFDLLVEKGICTTVLPQLSKLHCQFIALWQATSSHFWPGLEMPRDLRQRQSTFGFEFAYRGNTQ